MFVHITLFKFRDSASDQEIDALWKEANALRKLKGVVDLKSGQNFASNSSGFTHAIVVSFRTKEAFDSYMTSSTRFAIRQRAEEMAERILDFDFEDESS